MKCQCKVKKDGKTVVAHFETLAEQVITDNERCFVSTEEKEKWNKTADREVEINTATVQDIINLFNTEEI